MRGEPSETHATASANTAEGHASFPLDWEHRSIAAADLGAFALDAGTRALKLDERAAELLGVSAEELSFEEYLQRVDSADRGRVEKRLLSALEKGGGVYHDEFRTSSKRWVAATGRPRSRDASGRICLFGVFSDTTLRRTTDDASARLVDEMARSLRFNDTLIGVVALDVEGALDSIIASSEDVRRETNDPRALGAAARIRQNAERIGRTVAQLLDITRARIDGRTPLSLRDTDLAEIVRNVANEVVAGEPRAKITVETRGDTSCTCDEGRISQIFANLLLNAVRHGSEPAGIRVLVDGTGARAVSAKVTNPGVIAPDAMPTLFNPFRRMRAEPPRANGEHGLGLGLYVARRITLGHGGDISVTSSAEGGTEFRVELPRATSSAAFSLSPDRGDEEAITLERLGGTDAQSRVTAALFGVLPVEERAPEAFAALVERHVEVLKLALERHIYRNAPVNLAGEVRALAEQLGSMGAGAGDVADLHAHALRKAIQGAPALKVQALVSEGRLLALELMGRLVTFYRKRSGFGSLTRPSETT